MSGSKSLYSHPAPSASFGECALKKWSIVLMAMSFAGLAVAQPTSSAEIAQKKAVEVVLVQSKVVKDSQGKEQLVEAASVKPGDVLQYTATYTNNTGKTVTRLVANLPIPEGLEYLPKTAKPGATLVKAATRDGKYAAEPLSRVVNGKSELIPYSEYRMLRWTLGQLPANGVTSVSARARVEAAALASPNSALSVPPAAVSAAAGSGPR